MTGQRRTKMPCNAEDPNGNLFFWCRRWKGRSGNLAKKWKTNADQGRFLRPKAHTILKCLENQWFSRICKIGWFLKVCFFHQNLVSWSYRRKSCPDFLVFRKDWISIVFLRPITDDHFLLLEGRSSFEYSALPLDNLIFLGIICFPSNNPLSLRIICFSVG